MRDLGISFLLFAIVMSIAGVGSQLRRIASTQDALLCIRAAEAGVKEIRLPKACRRPLPYREAR